MTEVAFWQVARMITFVPAFDRSYYSEYIYCAESHTEA